MTAAVFAGVVVITTSGMLFAARWLIGRPDPDLAPPPDNVIVADFRAMNAHHDVPTNEPPAEILACPYPAADPGAVTEAIARLAPEDPSGPDGSARPQYSPAEGALSADSGEPGPEATSPSGLAMVPGETPGQAPEREPIETAGPEDWRCGGTGDDCTCDADGQPLDDALGGGVHARCGDPWDKHPANGCVLAVPELGDYVAWVLAKPVQPVCVITGTPEDLRRYLAEADNILPIEHMFEGLDTDRLLARAERVLAGAA